MKDYSRAVTTLFCKVGIHLDEEPVHTLLLADLHSIQHLKSACLGFAAAHFSEVKKTTGWDPLKTCNRELYIDILEAQATQQSAPPLMKKPRCIRS